MSVPPLAQLFTGLHVFNSDLLQCPQTQNKSCSPIPQPSYCFAVQWVCMCCNNGKLITHLPCPWTAPQSLG